MTPRVVNLKSTLAFSLTMIVGTLILYGPGLHTLVIIVPVLLLSNLAFRRWKGGPFSTVIAETALRSLIFAILLFAFQVLWIKVTSPGQAGYGDQLQFDGSTITLLGYWSLLAWSGKIASLAFVAGLVGNRVFDGN